MSDLRADVLDIARSQLGVTEDPPESNMTPYGAYFGKDGEKWCAMFVSWVFAQAGAALPNLNDLEADGGYSYCPSAVEYATRMGETVDELEPGDIVLYDFNHDGRSEHTGIVETVNGDDSFVAIEGNTSTSSDDNGGAVMERDRRRSQVAVFWRPAVLGDSPNGTGDLDVDVTAPETSSILDLQRYLLALSKLFGDGGLNPGVVDGLDGPNTQAAVSALQRRAGASETGEWSPDVLDAVRSYIVDLVSRLYRIHELRGAFDSSRETELTAPATSSILDLQGYLLELSELLGDSRLDPGVVDGLDGPNTRAAVSALQRRAGVPGTGQLSPDLLDAVRSYVVSLAGTLYRIHALDPSELP